MNIRNYASCYISLAYGAGSWKTEDRSFRILNILVQIWSYFILTGKKADIRLKYLFETQKQW